MAIILGPRNMTTYKYATTSATVGNGLSINGHSFTLGSATNKTMRIKTKLQQITIWAVYSQAVVQIATIFLMKGSEGAEKVDTRIMVQKWS